MAKQFVGFWIDEAEYERMRQAAARQYEGNFSLWARVNLRESLARSLRNFETVKSQTPRPTWPGRAEDQEE